MIELIVTITILAIVTEAITEIIVDSKLFESFRNRVVDTHINIVNTITIIELIIASKETKISWPEIVERHEIPDNIKRDVVTSVEKLFRAAKESRTWYESAKCPLNIRIKSFVMWWLSSILSCGYCFSVYVAALTSFFVSLNVTNFSVINYFIAVFLLHRLSNIIHIIISRVSTERMKYLTITIDRNKND